MTVGAAAAAQSLPAVSGLMMLQNRRRLGRESAILVARVRAVPLSLLRGWRLQLALLHPKLRQHVHLQPSWGPPPARLLLLLQLHQLLLPLQGVRLQQRSRQGQWRRMTRGPLHSHSRKLVALMTKTCTGRQQPVRSQASLPLPKGQKGLLHREHPHLLRLFTRQQLRCRRELSQKGPDHGAQARPWVPQAPQRSSLPHRRTVGRRRSPCASLTLPQAAPPPSRS